MLSGRPSGCFNQQDVPAVNHLQVYCFKADQSEPEYCPEFDVIKARKMTWILKVTFNIGSLNIQLVLDFGRGKTHLMLPTEEHLRR